MKRIITPILALIAAAPFCSKAGEHEKIRVVLDTDANNELDDQHAIAYMLFNGDVFDVEGITVNKTRNGGNVNQHLEEAERVVELCNLDGQVRCYRGANGNFEQIRDHVKEPEFDGHEAVDFIIRTAKTYSPEKKLVLLPVGKLTNIALALHKDPSIAPKVRIVWLGSNYPRPGEYNQDNDVPSMNYILDTQVDFEIALVRYGQPSGTAAVKASLEEIEEKMPSLGPHISEPVTGRHGGEFDTFGDYAVELFRKMGHKSRALFDMAAVAILKNPSWAKSTVIPAPHLVSGKWVERPDNPRRITVWEDFDRDAIMKDFYNTMKSPCLVGNLRD
jgi:inosine-uridine nucleoside N-ribohydrolase